MEKGVMMKGVRKAYASKGDDSTLCRFVKIPGEHKPRNHNPRLPGFELAFVQEARTKFPKTVVQPGAVTNMLTTGHSNVKIGRDVRKGKHRGYWIYTLSLEERKTCPNTCKHWQTCYGNNMPFAKRLDHTHPAFLTTLEKEIDTLIAGTYRKNSKATGILIRLHALGDFFSPEYVAFWSRMLATYSCLAVYGYTAWGSGTAIGWMLYELNKDFPGRSMIRFSNSGFRKMSTISINRKDSRPENVFICPEQTGKTLCCATCGACWSTTKNVAFLEH